MAETHSIDRELAKQSPHMAFRNPAELRDAVLLTYGEKLATLERWRLDTLHELSAGSEGMPLQGSSSPLLKRLEEIEHAKEALRAQHNSLSKKTD